MRSLFGVPQDILLLAVSVLLGLVVLTLAATCLRNPLLLKLALRSVPRRPGLAALITLGLTLGTVIFSSALTTGDTMSLAVRSVVAGALGTTDEVIFVPKRARRSAYEVAQALANGTFLSGSSEYFPEGEVGRFDALLEGDPRVAAVLPTLLKQATVVAPGRGFRAQMTLLGLPSLAAAAHGAPRSTDGSPFDLAALSASDVLVNGEAAVALNVAPGDRLVVFGLAEEFELDVAGVVRVGELGGSQATLFLPLARLQELAGHPGEINHILVANRGNPAERLRNSWSITARLRAALLDEASAQRLFRSFGAPAVRQNLETQLLRSTGRQADKLQRLIGTLDATEATPEFAALAQDPELLSRLAAGLGSSPRDLEQGPLFAGTAERRFRVLDVQQVAQDQADRWASALTGLFVVLGLFSLFTGLLLIVLVFSLLALERRGELGVLRALGGRRRDVIMLLALEGALYSLASSVFGLALGIALAYGLIALADRLAAQYGFHLEPAVEAGSLALSFALGWVLTFVTIVFASWRSSRFSIVTAIRDLPDPVSGRAGLRGLLAGALILVGGYVLIKLGFERFWSLAYACGVALAIVGLALLARWLLRRIGARGSERVVLSLAGLGLLTFWYLPVEWLQFLGLPAFGRVLEMSALSGMAMLLGAVWVVAYNVGLLRLIRGGASLWRLSTAEVAAHRFRTGMTLAMFGLVMLSLTVAAVLLTVTHMAYGDPQAATGGWDIRAESPEPPRDLRPELVEGLLSPEAFFGVGATATFPVQGLQLDDPAARWRPSQLMTVDEGFAETAPTSLTGSTIEDPRATWQELTRRPGAALVGAALLSSGPTELRVIAREGREFRPFVLWVRDARASASAVRLEVIGLVDSRGPFGSSVIVGSRTLDGWAPPDRATYYFKAADGESPRELAAGLTLAIPELAAQPLGEEVRLVQGVRGLVTAVLQAFMGIGLLSGLSALGVISARAVVERRRQFGVLRAIGFTSRAVGLGLLAESGLIALLGALLGVGIGLAVAQGTVEFLSHQHPELRFGVPWDQIGGLVLLVLLAALALTLLPAHQAARLSPAEALRET